MGDITVGAIIFIVVVWAMILGAAACSLLKITRHKD